jgi:hypothetical protein
VVEQAEALVVHDLGHPPLKEVQVPHQVVVFSVFDVVQ